MTSVPDSIVVGARERLVASYEDLRRSALGCMAGSGRGIGFGLFLRSGMATWMERCAALIRSPEAVARRSTTEPSLVPQDFGVEVAMLLAEMALSAYGQRGVTT